MFAVPLSLAIYFLFSVCFCRNCCLKQQYSMKCHKIKATRRRVCSLQLCIRGIHGRVLILKFLSKAKQRFAFFDRPFFSFSFYVAATYNMFIFFLQIISNYNNMTALLTHYNL